MAAQAAHEGDEGGYRLLNVKHLLKVEPYRGEKGKFLSWKWEFQVAVRAMAPELTQPMKFIESHLENDYKLSRLSEQEQKQAQNLYTMLAMLCKDDAAEFVMTSEEDNGFEAWKALIRTRTVRSATALMNKLMEPDFTSSDPRVNLKAWNKQAQTYFEKTGERVADTIRRTVYINKVAPQDLRQHLMMNKARLQLCEDIAEEIEDYCDVQEEMDQSKDGLVAAVSGKAKARASRRARTRTRSSRATARTRATARARASSTRACAQEPRAWRAAPLWRHV